MATPTRGWVGHRRCRPPAAAAACVRPSWRSIDLFPRLCIYAVGSHQIVLDASASDPLLRDRGGTAHEREQQRVLRPRGEKDSAVPCSSNDRHRRTREERPGFFSSTAADCNSAAAKSSNTISHHCSLSILIGRFIQSCTALMFLLSFWAAQGPFPAWTEESGTGGHTGIAGVHIN